MKNVQELHKQLHQNIFHKILKKKIYAEDRKKKIKKFRSENLSKLNEIASASKKKKINK